MKKFTEINESILDNTETNIKKGDDMSKGVEYITLLEKLGASNKMLDNKMRTNCKKLYHDRFGNKLSEGDLVFTDWQYGIIYRLLELSDCYDKGGEFTINSNAINAESSAIDIVVDYGIIDKNI